MQEGLGKDRTGPLRNGEVSLWTGLARQDGTGEVGNDGARIGRQRRGRAGWARQGQDRLSTARYGTAEQARPGGPAVQEWHGLAWSGKVGRGLAGEVWRGDESSGLERRGEARQGLAG